ncbi:alpha/beta hydrolase [Cryobacterium tagatosivorans]|uniref:Alpha/beta hydrolase n=2 Tax=Cryobacterium tagatosivorans TaxID=1259199 RepID=A0A4R8UF01_9MICO|nr:alpha/beta hydrolase [Cryobacterium tagatosivorans]
MLDHPRTPARAAAAPDQPAPGKSRRRWTRRLRITGIVALSALGLALASTTVNLTLESAERASIAPYGERVKVSGGSLNVYQTGTVGPPIVLLSGLGTAAPALDFAPLIRALGDRKTIVVEGFGYGYSDMTAPARTVENITAEIHEALARIGVAEPYVLAGHSISGFYTLYYANAYPEEVSAVIGIDPTMPSGKADQRAAGESKGSKGGIPWSRIPSVTGLVRLADSIAPSLAEPAGDAYTASERERLRLMSSWNFANPALTDEGLEMGNNAWKLQGLSYPDGIPVLDFLAQESIDTIPGWVGDHERQLENVRQHKIVLLKGDHYLHWTQSAVMAEEITDFLKATS